MAHINNIQDTETHFVIDPSTRSITNSSAANNIIVQYDHNSERFTFEMPRYVEGHDMYESTSVRIHYRNSASTNVTKTNGVYTPDDFTVSGENEDTIMFSWLLSSATTQYIGSLQFSIQFLCLDGETIVYSWNTGIYKDIMIIESINNTDEVVEKNVDEITALVEDALENAKNKTQYAYDVTDDGVLYLNCFTAGVQLLSSDDKVLCASNTINITAKENG